MRQSMDCIVMPLPQAAEAPALEVTHGRFILQRAAIHLSRSSGHRRGILWCWRCASYTTGVASDYLYSECLQPVNLQRGPAHAHRRLRQGLPLARRHGWPRQRTMLHPSCCARLSRLLLLQFMFLHLSAELIATRSRSCCRAQL